MSGLTMGSLFDGIGGFPLAAIRSGITPVWASEIEAFPIEVTKQRFPSMIHVGDITKLNGAELPPVDIICGGSPCQDLSVAGARAGLSGARSGLFMYYQSLYLQITKGYVRLKMECKDYILAQKTAIDALRFDPKDSELNMYAILAMGFQGNLSMAQTYYTAAKPYLALEHAEVIKKYLHIK